MMPAPEIEGDNKLVLRDVIAARLEITTDALRKRVDRLVMKMVERLGGEPPWVS